MKVFATVIHVCHSIIRTIGQILRMFPFKSLNLFKNSLTSPFPALKALRFCNKLISFQFKKSIPKVHLYRIVKISGNKNVMPSLAFSTKIKVLVSYLIILKSRHFEVLLKKKIHTTATSYSFSFPLFHSKGVFILIITIWTLFLDYTSIYFLWRTANSPTYSLLTSLKRVCTYGQSTCGYI